MKLSKTYKSVRPACVAFAFENDSRKFCFGSGVCMDPSGIIVTARHVVEEFSNQSKPGFSVVFSRKIENGHEAISVDPINMVMSSEYDVAVLKIPVTDKGWPFIRFPHLWNTVEGDEIATSGFPLRSWNDSNALPNLFSGIVSQIQEKHNDDQGWEICNLVLDISIHPGNSGGPVFNSITGGTNWDNHLSEDKTII